jgi:hypothetical protein
VMRAIEKLVDKQENTEKRSLRNHPATEINQQKNLKQTKTKKDDTMIVVTEDIKPNQQEPLDIVIIEETQKATPKAIRTESPRSSKPVRKEIKNEEIKHIEIQKEVPKEELNSSQKKSQKETHKEIQNANQKETKAKEDIPNMDKKQVINSNYNIPTVNTVHKFTFHEELNQTITDISSFQQIIFPSAKIVNSLHTPESYEKATSQSNIKRRTKTERSKNGGNRFSDLMIKF